MLGRMFMAASPQKSLSSIKSEMWSAVWPGVSRTLNGKLSVRNSSESVVMRRGRNTSRMAGNLCSPLPQSARYWQKRSASRLEHPPSNEFWPFLSRSMAFGCKMTFASVVSRTSFRNPA